MVQLPQVVSDLGSMQALSWFDLRSASGTFKRVGLLGRQLFEGARLPVGVDSIAEGRGAAAEHAGEFADISCRFVDGSDDATCTRPDFLLSVIRRRY